jgi:hypothetical protein
MNASHRELPSSHVRAAQVLATAWLITGQSFAFPPPHLSILEGFMDFPWRIELALFSTIGCLAILFTGFTRLGCLAVSFTIALELAATKTWFSHNRLFVVALLLTIALSDRRHRWLPRAQVGLVFLCAGLDKLLAPAWRDGTFVTSFLEQLSRFGLMWSPAHTVGGGENTLASLLRTLVGDGRLAGLVVIAVELTIAGLFFANMKHGAWLNLLFHLGVFAVTGGTMGQSLPKASMAPASCSARNGKKRSMRAAPSARSAPGASWNLCSGCMLAQRPFMRGRSSGCTVCACSIRSASRAGTPRNSDASAAAGLKGA